MFLCVVFNDKELFKVMLLKIICFIIINVDLNCCRFLCHIVLVLRKLERSPEVTSSEKGTRVLTAYASYLMQTDRAQQVKTNLILIITK